jgi:hypothetical protein
MSILIELEMYAIQQENVPCYELPFNKHMPPTEW